MSKQPLAVLLQSSPSWMSEWVLATACFLNKVAWTKFFHEDVSANRVIYELLENIIFGFCQSKYHFSDATIQKS